MRTKSGEICLPVVATDRTIDAGGGAGDDQIAGGAGYDQVIAGDVQFGQTAIENLFGQEL